MSSPQVKFKSSQVSSLSLGRWTYSQVYVIITAFVINSVYATITFTLSSLTYCHMFQESSAVPNDCIIDRLHKDCCVRAFRINPKANSSTSSRMSVCNGSGSFWVISDSNVYYFTGFYNNRHSIYLVVALIFMVQVVAQKSSKNDGKNLKILGDWSDNMLDNWQGSGGGWGDPRWTRQAMLILWPLI